jgi:hypothetical protein
LRRGTPAAIPAAAITALLAAITTILLAPVLLDTVLLATVGLTAALTVAATVAALPLLLLGDHRAGGSGFSRRAAEQRQDHGGRDQTFHFVLQGALCAAPALSLDSNIGCRG